jgi:membrane protein implicated in regulation of membrane protease activity
VTVRTGPEDIKGKVRIDSDVWSATSDEPIEAGTEVTVIKSQGVHVTVRRK